MRYNPLIPSNLDLLKERLAKANSDWNQFEKVDSFFWILEFNSRWVGTASVQNINHTMLTAEIGYGITPEFRGRGLATLAVRDLTKMAFCNTPLRKLIAFVHEENLPSRKLLENIGFHKEGLLREHYLINGLPVNEIIYGILRSEGQIDDLNC